jgi:Tfp pilus assembly protein PilN
VRVVEVEQAGGETRLVRRASAQLPQNCWNDIPANREAMAASVREAMAAAGIATKTVVACLPRRLVTVRVARLPHAPPEQIRGMIEFEAQQYILFPLNEVILDYHVPQGIGSGITSGQDDMQTVLLAAARRSLVADIVSVFDRVGVELTQLSVSALALAEHIRDSLEPTAVIALESGAMDVSVVADGQLLFTRSSALDVAGIAREVAGRRFSEEVARSFTAYQNEFRQKPLAHVYLCGSETATTDGDWMDQALVEALEKPVARLHSRLIPTADPDARSYAIAAGMALEALGGALSDINLVPNDRAEQRAQTQKTRRQQLMALVAVAAVIAGLLYVRTAMAEQEKRNKETVQANNEMAAALKAEKPVQREFDRVSAMDRVLTEQLDRNHPSVDVLVAINRCLPRSTDIWLTQMNFDRGGLMTLRGDSKNSRAITDMLINLQASGAFTDVKLSYIADAQDTLGPSDVVRAAPKPAAGPLPGLPPPSTNVPVLGAIPGAPGTAQTPGAVVPGANPGAAGFNPATGGFNPAGGGVNPGGGRFGPSGGYNPAGGSFNPNGGEFNPNGGANSGRRGRGGFGGQGGFGATQTFTPGAQPAFNPGVTQAPAPAPVQAMPTAPANGTQVVTTPGQTVITPGGQVEFSGPAPAAQLQTPPATGNPSFPTQGGQPQQFGGGAGGNRMVFTPEMAARMRAAGGAGGFDPAAIAAWRQRMGVTGAPGTSSVNMTAGASGMPGAQLPGAAPGGSPSPTINPATTTKKTVVTTKTSKPTITGFVITCRLRKNAKLIPPDMNDVTRNKGGHETAAAPTVRTTIHDSSDSSDDTGDNE